MINPVYRGSAFPSTSVKVPKPAATNALCQAFRRFVAWTLRLGRNWNYLRFRRRVRRIRRESVGDASILACRKPDRRAIQMGPFP
jgi:hypothetical protein